MDRRMKYKNKIRLMIKEILGTKCYFCKYNIKTEAHRKDGKPHKQLARHLGIPSLMKELKSGKYITLCHRCHKSIHWCMKYLRLNWEDITKLASARGTIYKVA